MFRPWNRLQFDSVECLLTALLLGLCVWCLIPRTPPPLRYTERMSLQELGRLKAAYGPAHYSQFEEEWIIRDFFKDRRDGFFVDVGANHYRDNSTTFYLEAHLGWSGLALDPQPGFEADYRRYRPRTRFLRFFVSGASGRTARLVIHGHDAQAREIAAPTITLTDLLNQFQIPRVDFLSIDVELSEPDVLAGFDIDRFKPTLVCIEAQEEVRQRILNFFGKHGYVVIGRYLWVDALNLYFTPLEP